MGKNVSGSMADQRHGGGHTWVIEGQKMVSLLEAEFTV